MYHPPPAHRRAGAIQHAQQRAALIIIAQRANQFQIAPGGQIDADKFAIVEPRQLRKMRQLVFLIFLQIGQRRARRTNSRGQIIAAEALQRQRLEMPGQFFISIIIGKLPALPAGDENIGIQQNFLPQPIRVFFGNENLRRFDIQNRFAQTAFRCFYRHLADKKFSGGNIHLRQPGGLLQRMNRQQKIITAARQQIIRQNTARRHDFGDLTLHHHFCQLRIFHLLANRHAMAGANHFREIRVQRMMRKSRQRHFRRLAVRPRGERDAQHLAGGFGIVVKHLIKIAHAKKQHRVFMLRLDREILPHQRRGQIVFVDLTFFFCNVQILNLFKFPISFFFERG